MRAIHKLTSQLTAPPTRRRVAIRVAASATLVAMLIAATVAVAAASTGAGSATRNKGRTIHLRSVLVSATVNSAGQGGAGDVVANLFSFTTSTGVTGHADISCTIFPNAQELCHASFVFPTGQIDAQAAITLPPTKFTAAVIGGTGSFDGATGQIRNVVVAPGVIDRTIELLPVNDKG